MFARSQTLFGSALAFKAPLRVVISVGGLTLLSKGHENDLMINAHEAGDLPVTGKAPAV